MKLITDRCCAANDSMFLLLSRSVSPNAYCAPLVENKMRASANVIHPRSSGGNADKERASVASVVPLSFMASGGGATSAPNSFAIRLIRAIFAIPSSRHDWPARLNESQDRKTGRGRGKVLERVTAHDHADRIDLFVQKF